MGHSRASHVGCDDLCSSAEAAGSCIRIFTTDKERSLVNCRSTLAETYSVRRVLADTDELYGAVRMTSSNCNREKSRASLRRLGLPSEQYIVLGAAPNTRVAVAMAPRPPRAFSFLLSSAFHSRE